MSRELILNDLVSQLDDLSNVSKATMRLLLFIDQEKYMPYIGVIPGDDIPVISDGYDTRYNMSVTLIVKTREDELPLETLISDIKTLMQSIDLGADVLSSKVVGIQEVDVQDEKSTRFSATGILLEIIYKENFGTDYPAIETRTLTEPDGVAHYKLYETLVSGSVSIQALGTNVYDTHFRAAMEIPAGSGSISIGSIVNAMDEDDDATSGDERIENHMMGFELRIHSSFISEFGNIPQPFIDRQIVDNTIPLIWGMTGAVLGNYYRVHQIGPVAYNQTFESTLGALMPVVVEKVISYT